MRILHLSKSDSGGAGGAAFSLHRALKSMGLNSQMLVLNRQNNDEDIVPFLKADTALNRIQKKVFNRLLALELKRYEKTKSPTIDGFNHCRTAYQISKHPLLKKADIIHLHWVANMIDYAEFFSNLRSKPIVWTLHDMNPFTGGCHYSDGCKKYETQCCACPQLGSKKNNDLSKKIFDIKQSFYEKQKITIVAISEWLSECAKRSHLLNPFEIRFIQHGVSTVLFGKRDKNQSRQKLGLPRDRKIILFGSNYKTWRKGFFYLIQTMKVLEQKTDIKEIALVLFGPYTFEDLQPFKLMVPVYFLRSMNKESLSFCYSAADITIVPSLEESFGLTCLESMACGTPVAGFNAGGLKELLNWEGDFGVDTKDVEKLAEKIVWAIKYPKECGEIGFKLQNKVKEIYSLEMQAQNYVKLYERLLHFN